MLKIAVTGSISSGKSTVCELLKVLGAYVLSSDDIVHKLLQSDKVIQNQLNQLLQTQLNFDNQQYRSQISEKIFSDPIKLQNVEKLLHSRVMSTIEQTYASCLKEGRFQLFVCEVPLLFEAHLENFFDEIVYVTAPKDCCIKRFKQKTNLGSDDWNRRMKRFFSEDLKLAQSSFIIDNSGSLDQLQNLVTKLYHSLLNK